MPDFPRIPDLNEMFASINTRLEALEGRPSTDQPPQPPQPVAESTHGDAVDSPDGYLVDALGRTWTLVPAADGMRGPYQIAREGAVQTITQGVMGLRYYKPPGEAIWNVPSGAVVQLNDQNTHYHNSPGAPGSEDAAQWTPLPGDPWNPPASSGVYSIRNGKIVDPNGNRIHLKGINIRHCNWPGNTNTVSHHAISDLARCTPLVETFPGINCVRFDAFEEMNQLQCASMDSICPLIDSMVAHNIVVEVECHVFPQVLQGGDLDRVCEWYRQLATRYKDEPRVIWGTQNEPNGPPDESIRRIYEAIRSTGNENLILMCINGGWSWNDMNPATYADMFGVCWDIHYYGWLPNYSQDQGECDRKLLEMINNGRRFTSRDGPIQSVCAEFSPAGFQGQNAQFVENQFWIDPNGLQVINSVYRSTELCGWMQWMWNTPETSQNNGIGHLLKLNGLDGSVLTDHGGKQCRDAIRA
jgi:hypothetical protein